MSDDAFRVHTADRGDHVVLAAEGDLDIAAVGAFSTAWDDVLETRPAGVVLDLSAVDFIDSSGLSGLVRGWRASQDAGTTLRVVAPTGQARTTLAMTGIDQLLGLEPEQRAP